MWPRSHMPSGELLRLGRVAAERWVDGPQGLVRQGAVPLHGTGALRADELLTALPTLFASPPSASVSVVLESAWVPVILVETGPTLWAGPQVEALVRHRFGLLHGDVVAGWDLRVDHQPGEHWALGYGFAPALRNVLDSAAATLNTRWSALTPAWAWGWQRVRPEKRWPQGTGHWAWAEQDRVLLGTFEHGRPVGLNPAVCHFTQTAGLNEAVAIESIRHGRLSSTLPAAASSWDTPAALPVASVAALEKVS